VQIDALSADTLIAAEDQLADLLRACVDGGASVGYLAPMPETEAREFWRSLLPSLRAGQRTILAARDDAGGIVGSGQVVFETRPNGRHRAEISKLLVLPSQRRRGIATRIMAELEHVARARGVRMLFLDTSEGPGGARGLYEALGYQYAGGIPDWALDPDGRPAQNAIFYKILAPAPAWPR